MKDAAHMPEARRACVIGAGLGGLATAIRLQAAGIGTVLIEARDRPGGRASAEIRDGFTFSSGPLALIGRSGIDALWALRGDKAEADAGLLPVAPLCRYSWPDGSSFDLSADDGALTREIARIAPGDLAGYEDFARFARDVLAVFGDRPGPMPCAGIGDLARLAPQLARAHAWRSLWSVAGSHVKSEKLREVLATPALMAGANPFAASALLAADHARERDEGLWWPEGGMGALAAALQARFVGLGGTMRLHDPVREIHTLGNRVHEVETQSGWRQRVDAVACSADLVHTARDLLAHSPRGAEMARKARNLPQGPGLFTVHFALEGTWPGIPHRMVLMGPRFRGLIDDIYRHGVLPQDQMIWLGHPSVTAPSLAPAGKSVFQAVVPVAHMGKLPIDWEAVGPMLEQRILDEVGRRLVPDIHDRIVHRFHTTPRDLALEFNARHGTGFGVDPRPLAAGGLCPPTRDPRIANLYLTGAAAMPGGGLPGALAAARICANSMLETLL
jgi:phytoene desaturase